MKIHLWKTNCITESTPTAIALVAYILFILMTGWKAIDTKSFTGLASAISRPHGWLEIDFFRNTLLRRSRKQASQNSTTSLSTHLALSISCKGLHTFTLRAFITVIFLLRTFFFRLGNFDSWSEHKLYT